MVDQIKNNISFGQTSKMSRSFLKKAKIEGTETLQEAVVRLADAAKEFKGKLLCYTQGNDIFIKINGKKEYKGPLEGLDNAFVRKIINNIINPNYDQQYKTYRQYQSAMNKTNEELRLNLRSE